MSLDAKKSPFEFALSYPREDGWGAILKGGLTLLLSFLIVPYFVLFGYVFRLYRSAARDEPQPAYTDYVELLKEGVWLFVAQLPFVAVVGILGFISIEYIHPAVYVLVVLAAVYVGPAVITVYAVTGDIGETYTSSRVPDFAFTVFYAKHAAMYIPLAILLGVVTMLSALALGVGILFGSAFATFAQASYWGRVYERAAAAGIVEPA
ncbi:DUF4013 domain-containing protein [Haloarchaeobius sp. HME9146]|uniref:DUF4013 domain-containing protein n=1 Tax=Haloarchaeobius sp. HME9146 TaxID=2978732 RepID=UPI0021C1181A|nr:DUF4013 domain-containing protein [Haloarchaeobius sp. HME9146]MCT9095024.1 DUF4013 domain-containing protein [Haloarchaeobius sp. HME9146]